MQVIEMTTNGQPTTAPTDSKERTFLDAAERGDKQTVIRCMQKPNPVNVNCTDMLGRSALQASDCV